MTAQQLYCDLRDRGLSLRLESGRLIVRPRDLITDVDDRAIRQHRDELLEIVTWEADEPAVSDSSPRRDHDVPSSCLGPRACTALGVCGRLACMTATEHETFAMPVVNAHAARNPHRVTRLVEAQDISITSLEEDDRAA